MKLETWRPRLPRLYLYSLESNQHMVGKEGWPMRGLEKHHMNRDWYIYIYIWTLPLLDRIGPLGRFDHRVTESVCAGRVCLRRVCLSPFHAFFFEASHWPSHHMTRSRPLIGQPSFPTIWWWWGEGEGGGHSGPALLHNFPKLKNLTRAPRHLRRSSQRNICNKNATFYPIVLTSGLEIEFYPILTLRWAL